MTPNLPLSGDFGYCYAIDKALTNYVWSYPCYFIPIVNLYFFQNLWNKKTSTKAVKMRRYYRH